MGQKELQYLFYLTNRFVFTNKFSDNVLLIRNRLLYVSIQKIKKKKQCFVHSFRCKLCSTENERSLKLSNGTRQKHGKKIQSKWLVT